MQLLEMIKQYQAELPDTASGQTYRATLPALLRFFCKQKRTELKVEDLVTYRRWLEQEDDYSKTTIKLYLTVFQQFLKWAVAKELLEGNLYLRMTTYAQTMGNNKRTAFVRRQIEPEDIQAILHAFFEPPAPDPGQESPSGQLQRLTYLRDRALVYLLAGTGMRIEEALSLDREPFDDFFGNWNSHREMVLQIMGKGNKPRDVILLPATLEKIRDYLSARSDPYPALLISHGNRRRSDGRITRQTAWHSITQEAQELGIKSFVAPHAFRHYYLDNLAQKGVDLRTLAQLAGHADVRITDRAYLGPVRTRELVKAVKNAAED